MLLTCRLGVRGGKNKLQVVPAAFTNCALVPCRVQYYEALYLMCATSGVASKRGRGGMLGTALKPSEVIQLTIVPSAHRQRGDGMSVPSPTRSFAIDDGSPDRMCIKLGDRLGACQGPCACATMKQILSEAKRYAFVRERSDFSVACHLDLAIFA